MKFEAEGQKFANFLRSLEQFIQTVKGNQIKKINPGLAKEDYKFGLQTRQTGQPGKAG